MTDYEEFERLIRRRIAYEKAEKEKAEKDSKKKELKKPEIKKDFKRAFFLGGDFGRDINEKVQGKYGRFDAIKEIVFKYDIVKGSNPFYCAAVQEFLPQEITIATQADLERILSSKTLELENHCEDSSLVWRSNADPNSYLAGDIYSQFKSRGIELIEGKAYVIPLFSLRLREDSKSPHKLSFEITDKTLENYFEAPILMGEKGYFSNEDIDDKTGLTKKIGEKTKTKNRRLHNRNSGVCRLDGGYGDIDSSNGNLAYSYEGGRVACIVRGEATRADGGGI